MYIAKHRRIFLAISAITSILAILSIIFFGLKLGIEFTGGMTIDVVVDQSVSKADLEKLLTEQLPGSTTSVQSLGESGYIIRTPFLTESEHADLTEALDTKAGITVEQTSSVGPTIGAELQKKAIIAVTLVTIAIVLFVAFAFRQVSKVVSSWAYGGATMISLLYDLLFTAGVYALFGVLFGAEVDSLFIIVLLTVLGYSVNDTIIVFDRIRENLRNNDKKKIKDDFVTTVGKSINQTMTRSINTSLTTSLALLALYIFGGEPTRIFALILLVGVISGTYSSIFFASPLLIWIQGLGSKKESEGKKKKKKK